MTNPTAAKKAVVRESRIAQQHKEGFALLEQYVQLTDITYAPTRNGKQRWHATVRGQDKAFRVTLWQEHVDFLQICGLHLPDGETHHIKYDEVRVGVAEYDRKWGHSGIETLFIDGRPFLDDIMWRMYYGEFDRHPFSTRWSGGKPS